MCPAHPAPPEQDRPFAQQVSGPGSLRPPCPSLRDTRLVRVGPLAPGEAPSQRKLETGSTTLERRRSFWRLVRDLVSPPVGCGPQFPSGPTLGVTSAPSLIRPVALPWGLPRSPSSFLGDSDNNSRRAPTSATRPIDPTGGFLKHAPRHGRHELCSWAAGEAPRQGHRCFGSPCFP